MNTIKPKITIRGKTFLSKREVARELQCSERTVNRMVERGDIVGVIIARRLYVPEESFEAYINDLLTPIEVSA